MRKLKFKILSLIAMVGTAMSSCAHTSEQYSNMNVLQFANFISGNGIQLLDVRTPEEFAEGHIEKAENINLFDENFIEKAEKELNKEHPVAVYCRSGRRSADAASKLADKGYKVTNLEGGILAWEEAGKPIER